VAGDSLATFLKKRKVQGGGERSDGLFSNPEEESGNRGEAIKEIVGALPHARGPFGKKRKLPSKPLLHGLETCGYNTDGSNLMGKKEDLKLSTDSRSARVRTND